VEFLETKMEVYAKQHKWEFDECDFSFAKGWTLDEPDAVASQEGDSVKGEDTAPQ